MSRLFEGTMTKQLKGRMNRLLEGKISRQLKRVIKMAVLVFSRNIREDRS